MLHNHLARIHVWPIVHRIQEILRIKSPTMPFLTMHGSHNNTYSVYNERLPSKFFNFAHDDTCVVYNFHLPQSPLL